MNSYKGLLIYGLKDPFTNEIRYVGRSSSGLKRPTEHLRPHQLKKKSHKSSWIKSLLSTRPEVVILETLSEPAQLNAAEIKWIAYYKNFGHRLTNHTVGGNGISGFHHSEEAKRKISEAFKGEKHPLFGRKLSHERRLEISFEQKGRVRSEIFKEKVSRGLGGRPFQVFSLETGQVIGEWTNQSRCAQELGMNRGYLRRVLAGEFTHGKGFIFKFKGAA